MSVRGSRTEAVDDKTKMPQIQHILKKKNQQGPKQMNGLENTIDPMLDLLKGETCWPIQYFFKKKTVSVLGHIQQLDENITSMMTRGKSIISNGQNQVRSTRCSMCGEKGRKSTINDHIAENHYEGLSHSYEI